MNNKRRKQISNIIKTLEESKDDITSVMEEEQEALDNMPEGFISGERGEKCQTAIDLLDDAINSLDEVIDSLEEAKQ